MTRSTPIDREDSMRSWFATLGVCALILVASAIAFASTLAPESSGTATSELPREWRWEREPVKFDHMYREGYRAPSVEDMYGSSR